MEQFVIRKAERRKRKARVGVLGPTGSGKTLGALLIAKGLGGSTVLIDTENFSGDLYAGHEKLQGWEYDVIELPKPFSVERYIGAIHAAEKSGFDNIIIDSASHAWAGPGGILEFVDKKTDQQNKFAGWRDATPKHNEFVHTMTESPANIICTMRVKMDYVLEENEKGKKVPKKVGLQPVQRDGLEYEFDVVLDVASSHTASSTKDRTSLFDGQFFTITDKTGEQLRAWLDSGVAAPDATAEREAKIADWCAKLDEAANVDALKDAYEKAVADVEPWATELQAQAVKNAKNTRLRALKEKEAA